MNDDHSPHRGVLPLPATFFSLPPALCVLLSALCVSAFASVPEPLVLYGTMNVGGRVLSGTTAAGCVVEARRASDDTRLTSFTLGSDPEANRLLYALRLNLCATLPVATDGVTSGEVVHLVVREGGLELARQVFTVAERGSVRLDFGPPVDTDGDGIPDFEETATDSTKWDTDGDGMPDGWEKAHGLNPTVNDAGGGNLDAYNAAKIIYVKQNATGTGDGKSWRNAFTDLSVALASATLGQEVWVCAGTYKPGRTSPTRSSSFALVAGVPVYGGFAGTETQRSARNVALNPTTLSGDIGTAGAAADNCYHVVTGADTTLDGFILRHGSADGVAPHDAGGAVLSAGSSPRVVNCRFVCNRASSGGGAISGDRGLTVVNSVFVGNTAALGGAVYAAAGTPLLVNCTFAANSAASAGGALYASSAAPVVVNSILRGDSPEEVAGDSNAWTEVSFSDIQGGWSGLGASNLDLSPRFVRQPGAGADGMWGTADDDLGDVQLAVGSPAIDHGNTAAVPAGVDQDLAGQPRVVGTSVDQGAYEGVVSYSISGTVTARGTVSGSVLVQAFANAEFTGAPLAQVTAQAGGQGWTYALTGLAAGTYYVRAFADANNDGLAGTAELQGASSRNPVSLAPSAATVDVVLALRFRWGELTGDGVVGTMDASALLRYKAGLIDSFPGYPTVVRPNTPPAADVSGDGVVGTMDASQILQRRAGLIARFSADTDGDGLGPESSRGASRDGESEDTSREVSVEPATVIAGEGVQVTVRIDTADGVCGFALWLQYPADAATYRDCAMGSLTEAWGEPLVNAATPGVLGVVSAGTQPLAGCGSLLTLCFDLAADSSGTMALATVELNDGAIRSHAAGAVSWGTDAVTGEGLNPILGVTGVPGLAGEPLTFGLELTAGWNLISLPLQPLTPDPGLLLAEVGVGPVWEWSDGAYQAATELVPGRGYWAYVPEVQLRGLAFRSVIISGTAVAESGLRTDLTPGWNLAGPIATPPYALVSLPTVVVPPDAVSSALAWRHGVYSEVTDLESGHGYWMNAARVCQLAFEPPR